jgi:FkbM family methyltransferase
MSLRSQLRSRGRALLERQDFGLAPRGFSPFIDLRRHLPGYRPTMFFDVGANVGQSARRFLTAYPAARIYSFEPLPSIFAELVRNVASDPHVTCLNIGLSDREGAAIMIEDADCSSIRTAGPGQEVQVRTLDSVCVEHGVDRIDFLKIDTEGHDLAVLRGAAQLFDERAIAAVQVEAGMHPENDSHVPFETLKAHLEEAGYRCFGIYSQSPEWVLEKPFLRWTDPVFVPA